MADLSHWEYAECFTSVELAYLFMGSDPNTDDGIRFPEHIQKKINNAYYNAIERAKFDVFLSNVLDFEDIEEAEKTLPPMKSCLMSKELEWRYASFMEGSEVTLSGWLESEGYNFSIQFTRKEVARWLRENSFKSVYEFEVPAATPELKSEKPLAARERSNLLNIIGALLGLNGTKEAAIIAELLEKYPATPGIKKRTLEDKFAEAKRSLQSN